MKNITTYYSSRKNVFVWLAVLLSLVSAVTHFMAFGGIGSAGLLMMVVYMLFPLAANLFISIRLPLRCGDMYYVTVGPSVLLAIYFLARIISLGISTAMTIVCIILCLVQCFAFVYTYTGRLNSKIPALIAWMLPLLFLLDGKFLSTISAYIENVLPLVLTDLCAWLSIVCVILASKKMPDEIKEGEIRRRYGDRSDGRRVRTAPVLTLMTVHFMFKRTGALNYISDSVEISNVERYIHDKRRQGYKHFGMTHMFLAAYCRAVAEYPALNRFIAGHNIYHRNDITCSMVIKKEMTADSPDTTIKVVLDPKDTAAEVYEKYNALVQENKETAELNNDTDKFMAILYKIPSLLLTGVVLLLRFMDYFGLCPPALLQLSPFHASMFITSMGSLGIPPIFHHLYDFGTIPQFCAFGAKRTVREIDSQGQVVSKKYIDFTWVLDERICDGFYYALVLKRMKQFFAHPELLDVPPEVVKEDIE